MDIAIGCPEYVKLIKVSGSDQEDVINVMCDWFEALCVDKMSNNA